MPNYAQVEDGVVIQVIVADQAFIDAGHVGGGWIKTDYGTRGNTHYGEDGQPDGGTPLRANYASIGHLYDVENDVFYAPQPFPSWILNNSTWTWEAPIAAPAPNGEDFFYWDEESVSWKAM